MLCTFTYTPPPRLLLLLLLYYYYYYYLYYYCCYYYYYYYRYCYCHYCQYYYYDDDDYYYYLAKSDADKASPQNSQKTLYFGFSARSVKSSTNELWRINHVTPHPNPKPLNPQTLIAPKIPLFWLFCTLHPKP